MGDEIATRVREEISELWEEFEISQKPHSVEGDTEFFDIESMGDAAHELKAVADRAAARIEALEAENARMREALILIRDHRAKCHAYDEDVGDCLREFDVEDVKLMEQAARAALAAAKETP